LIILTQPQDEEEFHQCEQDLCDHMERVDSGEIDLRLFPLKIHSSLSNLGNFESAMIVCFIFNTRVKK